MPHEANKKAGYFRLFLIPGGEGRDTIYYQF